MKRGSGNTVVIAHSNGIATRYYHLSRFARGLHAGQTVKQKDVIGFVGTTGLSTGPTCISASPRTAPSSTPASCRSAVTPRSRSAPLSSTPSARGSRP